MLGCAFGLYARGQRRRGDKGDPDCGSAADEKAIKGCRYHARSRGIELDSKKCGGSGTMMSASACVTGNSNASSCLIVRRGTCRMRTTSTRKERTKTKLTNRCSFRCMCLLIFCPGRASRSYSRSDWDTSHSYTAFCVTVAH